MLDARSRTDDKDRTLRTVFSSSSSILEAKAKRLFTLLGLHPRSYIGVPAAAALAGMTLAETEDAFDVLVNACFAEQKTGDGYHLHELLYSYAADMVHRMSTEEERLTALGRMFDYYFGAVNAAIRSIAPALNDVPPFSPGDQTTVEVPDFVDREAALNWCAERSVVLAVSRYAAEYGFHGHVWRIVGRFGEVLRRYGDTNDVIDIHVLAVRSTIKDGSREGEGMLNNNLGMMYLTSRKYREAEACLGRVLAIGIERDDLAAQAYAHHNLGTALLERGRFKEAIWHCEKGLALFTELGDDRCRGQACLRLGDVYRAMNRPEAASRYYVDSLGIFGKIESEERAGPLIRMASLAANRQDYENAVKYAEESLARYARIHEKRKMYGVLVELSQILCKAQDYDRAADRARESVLVAEECDDLAGKAEALHRLGQIQLESGAPEAAYDSWTQARTLFIELQDARASNVDVSLTGLEALQGIPSARQRPTGVSESRR